MTSRRRVVAALTVAVITGVLVCACAQHAEPQADPSRVVVDETANGTTVTLPDPGELVVRLPAVSGTGYTWTTTSLDHRFLAETAPGPVTDTPTGSSIPGSTTTTAFTFLTRTPGTTEVEVQYRRPWEPGPPEKVFHVQVTIT
ncbi:protease inhibitor I42 family protein [Rhodococcus jostii]|uniref:protease inhibitor I42 family protein n=1 Tax=Rhodococcus jostii TaxID=132919 RepID=UPI00362745ED